MPDVNNDFDVEFDAWGRGTNINPQIPKTIWHMESSGGKNTGKAIPDDPDSPVGQMQMRPSTAARMATKLGLDPKGVDLQDMRWAIPLGTAYVAEAANKSHGDVPTMFGYYFSGTTDQSKWGPKTRAYVDRAMKLYPSMGLKLPQEQQPSPPADAGTAQPEQ